MKRTLCFNIALLLAMGLYAYDFQDGDLYYNIISDSTVEVTYQNAYWGWDVNYEGLTSVAIPETVIHEDTTYRVTRIGDYAFYNCTGLTSITIPKSVTSIGTDAFEHTPWYNGQDGIVYAGSVLYKYKGNMPAGTSIVVQDGINTIAAYAFSGCTGLTSITIPESVTSIGTDAFEDTPWYDGQDGIVYAGSVLYKYKGDMPAGTSIVVQDGIKTIAAHAFSGCLGLTSITIPKSVKSIGEKAFEGCNSLKYVYYQGDLEDWLDIDFEYKPDTTFYNSDAKGANPLENTVDSLFFNNVYVADIIIPEGVNKIKPFVFPKYAGLRSVKLPSSLKEIGDYAFFRCPITLIELPNMNAGSVKIGKYAFAECTELKKLNIPHSVTSLGYGAFSNCTGMDTLIIGNGITDIDDQFEDCSGITYLQLGSGVKTIDHNAFYDAKKLKRIVCYAIEPPVAQVQDGWNNGSFYNYNIHVQVPCDNLEDYETDAVWGSFKYLECVGAEKTETNGKVLVTPRDNDADITWPTNSSAATYTILITQDDMEICTLVFNADGQLTRIAFAAPARNGEQRRTPAALLTQDGYRFTVTGLSSATQYAYAIDVKDAKSNVLNTYKGSFTTTGVVTGFEDTPATNEALGSDAPRKVFRDGQVYILRGGKTYTLTGEEVE